MAFIGFKNSKSGVLTSFAPCAILQKSDIANRSPINKNIGKNFNHILK